MTNSNPFEVLDQIIKQEEKVKPKKHNYSSSKEKNRSSGKKNKHSIHKPLKKQNGKSFIHIGHDNWNLVLHMMMGVR